jgi:hypothetical protein
MPHKKIGREKLDRFFKKRFGNGVPDWRAASLLIQERDLRYLTLS